MKSYKQRWGKKHPEPTGVDFETYKIEGRPVYPPVPVGVSIKKWGQQAYYYAWGHVNGVNNCTKAKAQKALIEAFACKDGILCHNAKFDMDVAEAHMGIKAPEWQMIHDTMVLLFLDDPHQAKIGLKPAAERVLGLPPDEQDAVANWLLKHQPVEGVKIGKGATSKHPPGAYIAYAPPAVVDPYANGDLLRTEQLFAHLYPSIVERGMLKAYDRERKLLPVLRDMERTGIRVDQARLERDVTMYRRTLVKLDAWIRTKLDIENLDSGSQVIRALQDAGLLDVEKVGVTPGGQLKSDKAALSAGVTDKQLAAALQYRTQLLTCLNTFMVNWLETAKLSGGLIFTTWHNLRGERGGTRTGRLSSTPNFQNMPKEFEPLFDHEQKGLPKSPIKDLPPLPLCRSYIVPYEPDDVLMGRDYSQQEPRILGHFEGGRLMEQYQADPWIDYHDNAKENLERIYQRPFKRKPVKNINLGIIYGQGAPSLAAKNGETVEETKKLKAAILNLYPGLQEMYREMRVRARSNQPIYTWGGREYYCEPPIMKNGRRIEFDYKMVNVLIQGSAADCTKEAMIRFYYHPKRRATWRMLLSVHDEIVLSVPLADLAEAQELLRECMESVEFDVKILSEGAWSPVSWGAMKDYDKKGKLIKEPGSCPPPSPKSKPSPRGRTAASRPTRSAR